MAGMRQQLSTPLPLEIFQNTLNSICQGYYIADSALGLMDGLHGLSKILLDYLTMILLHSYSQNQELGLITKNTVSKIP